MEYYLNDATPLTSQLPKLVHFHTWHVSHGARGTDSASI